MIQSWLFSRRRMVACLSALVIAFSVATAGAQTKGSRVNISPSFATEKPAAAPVAPTGPAPKIGADTPKHDFGEIWVGTKATHTFVVRNTGDALLKISRVKPSCGCTVAKFDSEVEPGKTGKIEVTVNTAKLKSKINKSVSVESNDTMKPVFKLEVTGTVKQRFQITPNRGESFGRIRPDEDLTRTLTLTNNMGTPVQLTLPTPKAGVYTAELVEKTPGNVYDLVITAKPPYAEKINRGAYKIRTDLPGNVTIDIALSAYVPPLVEVTPPQVIIPKTQATARQQSVRVKFNSKEPHKVLSATTNAPGAQVEIKEIAESHYDVVLGLPANYSPPTTGHKLTLKTDDPKNAEVEVKIAQRQSPKRAAPQRPAMQLSGKPVPDATFVLANGTPLKTSEMKDDATVVMFYASWCGFCKRTLPQLEAYSKEFKDKPVKFVAISMDSLKENGDTGKRARSKQQVVDQFKSMGVTIPQAFDSNKDGGSKFKVQSFPTMFLFGKTGKIDRVYVGGAAASDGSMKKDIETLLSGKTLAAQSLAPVKPKKRERPALKMAGKPAPTGTFSAASDGSTVSLASSDAEATVAFFYASWCGYCKKTLPVLTAMSAEYEGKPVRFIGVNQDTIIDQPDPKNRRAKTKDYVMKQWSDLGVTFPQIMDPNGIGRKDFKVTSYPTYFLIDKSGKIEKAYVGGTAAGNGALKKDIDALLKGNGGKASAGK